MKKVNKENPLTHFRKANEARQKVVKKSIQKAQNGAIVSDKTRVDNPYKTKYPTPSNKKKDPEELSRQELDALSHQQRGWGDGPVPYKKYVGEGAYYGKNYNNNIGWLSDKQEKQLKKYMQSASLGKKIYEALPNVGAPFGLGASQLPKGSKLLKQKKGGTVKSKKK